MTNADDGVVKTTTQSPVKLGSVGIWTRQFEDHPAAKVQEAARELEELGYGAIWFGEAAGREALTHAGLLLAATRRIIVATGIANIYGRDPVTMAAGQKTLADLPDWSSRVAQGLRILRQQMALCFGVMGSNRRDHIGPEGFRLKSNAALLWVLCQFPLRDGCRPPRRDGRGEDGVG